MADLDLLVVHGVGNPAVGDVGTAVATTLKRASLRGRGTIYVTECNWNQIVEPSARGGVILGSAWTDLSMCLAHASAIGEGPLVNNQFVQFLRVVSGLALMFAELCLAVAFATFLIVLPLLFAFSVFTGMDTFWTVGIHAVILFAGWSTVAGFGALAILVFSGSIRTFVVASWVPLSVELRRALILIMRPVLTIGTLFFLIPWRKLTANNDWAVIFFILFPLTGVGMIIVFGLVAYWLGREDFTWTAVGGSALIFCGLLFGIGIAGLVVTLITVRAFAPSLKIALDIFRYIGSTSYRDKIQSHLNWKIRKLSGDRVKAPRPLFIVSHSLGTVIVLHSLLSSEIWSENAEITLITLGSPVRRFFMRFFPGLFFPASITDLAEAIASRVREFRWINCYRPWDQVGTALGLNGLSYAKDLSTRQWKRIWNAHPDYWSDDHVLDTIKKAIREIPVHSAVLTHGDGPAPQHFVVTQGVDTVEKIRQGIMSAIFTATTIGFLLIPPVSAGIVVWSRYSYRLNEAAEARVIETNGISTVAAVTHWRSGSPPMNGAPAQWTDNYDITYMSHDGQVHAATITRTEWRPFEKSTYYANFDTLLDYVRSHCSDVDTSPLRKNVNHLFRRCRCEQVRLRYAQDAPEQFVLVDFPPNRTWWNTLRDGAFLAYMCFASFGTFATVLIAGGYLLMVVLGIPKQTLAWLKPRTELQKEARGLR